MDKVLSFFNNHKKQILLSVIISILFLSVFICYSYFRSKGGISIVSVFAKTENGVIDLASKFIVKTNANYSVAEVSELIYLEPAVNYDIKKLSSRKFEIIPEEKLPANTIISLGAVKDKTIVYKWAFQTESKLNVIGTFPANGSEKADVESAIEINFSYANSEMEESSFSISPETKGVLSKVGTYRWAFIAENNLLEDTEYTVTIKKGIKATDQVLNEDYVFNFKTGKKISSSINKAHFYINQTSYASIETFTTKDKPLIYINSYNTDKTEYDVNLNIFKIDNINDYIYLFEKKAEKIDTNNMNVYKTYSLKYIVDNPFLNFPDLLDEGYYYVQVLIDGNTLNHFVQINNLVTYVSSLENDNLIWVNDYLTGKPVDNLEVTLNNDKRNTDFNGISIIPNSSKNEETINYIKVGTNLNNPLLVGIPSFSNQHPTAYIYSDKTIYRPTDEIKIWGVVPTYRFNKTIDKRFEVLVGNYSKEVTLNEDGTFETIISIKDYTDDYAMISLEYDKEKIGYRNINIYNYEKPLYTYTLNTDKAYYFANENINVDINVEHISGIKAYNKNIRVVYGDYSEEKVYYATTDVNGNAKLTMPAIIFSDYTGEYSISVSSGDSEESSNYVQTKGIGVFGRTYAMSSEIERINDSYTLNINAYKIDLDKLNQKSNAFSYSNLYSPNYYYGEKIDVSVKVDIKEYTQEKIYSDKKIYDPMTKTYYHSYEISTNEEIIESNSYYTVNGELKLGNLNYFPISTTDYTKTYSAIITIYDSNNKVIKESNYFYDDSMTSSYYYENPFSFADDKRIYNFEDDILLSLVSKDNNLEINDEGKILSLTYNYGVKDYKITSANEKISYKYDSKIYPDGVITGAYYYDGRIYKISEKRIDYNIDGHNLGIEISTDNAVYKPGDEVTVNIKLKDINGNPIKGKVNLSIVDEAVFLISEDFTNILQKLYQRIYYDNYNYTTFRYYRETIGGGMGGAIGGGIGKTRLDFRDTSLFQTIETDNNGNGTIKFKLSDSVTTWRITAHGMTDNHNYGTSIKKIETQLPFFIQTTSPRNVKTTDDFVVSASSLGDGTGNVLYTFSIEKLNITRTVSGKIREYVHANFGNLPVGKYSVLISANYNGNSDAYKYDFEVKESFQETNIKTIQKITDGSLTIKPTRNPVQLYVYDESLDFYLDIIEKLSTQYGSRVDTIIGNIKAKELRTKYYNDEEISDSVIDLSEFQTVKGIKPLKNDTEDILLSALAAKYSLNYFNEIDLYNLFREVVDKGLVRSEVLKAYIGLAALKKPILIELNYLKENESRSDVNESLYLAMSYAFIGSYDSAKEIYHKEIKNVENIDNYSKSLKAILTSMIDVSESNNIIKDMEFDIKNNEYLAFALISYVENTTLYLQTPDKLSVTIDDEKEEYTIKKMHILKILSDKETLETLKFNSKSKNLILEQRYIGNYKNIEDRNIKYIVNASIDNVVLKSQIAKLNIELTDLEAMTYGKIKISLPNGLRLNQRAIAISDDVYLIDNKIDYIELLVSSKNSSVKFSIELIATNKGKYTIEPIIYEYNGNYGISNELKIEIK